MTQEEIKIPEGSLVVKRINTDSKPSTFNPSFSDSIGVAIALEDIHCGDTVSVSTFSTPQPKEEEAFAPNCNHQCSGNCRRVGCNCECGEWHGKYEPTPEEEKQAMEDMECWHVQNHLKECKKCLETAQSIINNN